MSPGTDHMVIAKNNVEGYNGSCKSRTSSYPNAGEQNEVGRKRWMSPGSVKTDHSGHHE